ncbi:hypothetical protein A2870_00230 [Candidatus Curtissbacteria bacterium RIFCSPHIGHO2_01_FULL_41_11]|uniref:Type 4 fimbrial biogenesis protein PilX N-terminal domain-containing protein n=1 Tax=Candidatus Curtissbacteria bacterium RIFCSPHIGHO2_01_FULL_41_11 TaxID=1797711 RepID=A0A1F5G4A6_9BACT|nr:MAG: hypothetical protein A2870_00230 [Candidatus Curtissbacteria bacterium RIFCSPHIGHO2_01_FULL_41_11]
MKLVYKKTKTVYRLRLASRSGSTVYKPGQILVIAVIFITVILIMTTSLFSRVAGYLQFGSNSIIRNQAVNLAEAGVDRTLWKLNATAGACDATCDDEITVGTTGTFKVSIAEKNPPNPQLKTVISTGYLPNSTNPRAKRTIKTDVQITSEGIAFRYAVQTGEGGVDMSQSSTITSSAGTATVYSNGDITAGSGTQQSIEGDAYAVGIIESPPITISGQPYPSASPQPLPNIQVKVNEAESQAEAGGIINCSSTPSECDISGSGTFKNIGPKKYINGNLTISNQAVVTVQNPVWVMGNLIVRNGGTQINLDNSFGSLGTYFIVDGTVTIEQGGTFNPTNANPKGYILVVSKSTSPSAVTISQSGANAVFYALTGGAVLSQTAQVNSLTAYSLSMQNSAILSYDTGLASAQFASGPGGAWQIKKGTYRFTSSP